MEEMMARKVSNIKARIRIIILIYKTSTERLRSPKYIGSSVERKQLGVGINEQGGRERRIGLMNAWYDV
jgi:hypothetical protein